MSNSQAYLKLIEKAKLYIPSGASFTGDLSERVRELYTLVGDDLSKGVISILPGDYVRTSSENDVGISLAAPIGYDIWYLFHTENILPFETGQGDERTTEILERLGQFLYSLHDIKPLRTLRSINDLTDMSSAFWARNYFENNGPYMIKEMRFETILEGKSFEYNSGGNPDNSIGYLAFPIGQLGVMEIVSLIGEATAEQEDFITSINASEMPVIGKEMMPPVHDDRGYCIGGHLIEKGYILQDNVEYLADDFKGQESIEPHKWLRRWISADSTSLMPGEFIALLAKPELYHVWWFQETYPFIYSGNWFETEYYTSGVIQGIIEPNSESGELTNIYKIWIKCWEIYLRPSDFYEYELGERVAIVKDIGEYKGNCNWLKIKSDGRTNESSNELIPDIGWRICPISFYKNEV